MRLNLIRKYNIFYFVCVALADEDPTIVSISPEQVKSINESVILNCTVSNLGEYSVVWSRRYRDRPDNVFLSLGNSMTMKDPRIKISIENATYMLHVSTIFNRIRRKKTLI